MESDHQSALEYGKRLISIATASAHAQHMYGHVLPHFSRWNEADRQFTIADELHKNWAEKNQVSPSEDWHYYHNLDLLSVTKMVVDPKAALDVLNIIQSSNVYGVFDYLDYATTVLPLNADEQSNQEDLMARVESQFPPLKDLVLGSRLYLNLVVDPSKKALEEASMAVSSNISFKKQESFLFFYVFTSSQN